MKSLLLIQKNSPIVDFIDLYLRPFSEVELIHVESVSGALKEIKGNTELASIFIGHSLEIDGDVKELTQLIKNYLGEHKSCKVIGSNKGLSTQDWVTYIPAIAPPVKIFEILRKSLDLDEGDSAGEFAPVPIFSLKYFVLAPCDVYFRLGKSEETIFVKRYKESDPLDQAEVQKYAAKDLKEIFVPACKLKEISDAIANQVTSVANLQRSSTNTFEPVAEALDYANFLLKNFGVQQGEQVIIKKVMENISFTLDKGKSKKIEGILKSKDTYFYKHVALTALLSSMLIGELKWEFSDDLQTAIVYAAFFQNFFITDEDEIACLDEVSMNFFKDKEKREKVRDHAKLAFDFIYKMKDVSYEAQKLVLEQHGSKFGIGFPDKKSNSSQLSALFMVANEFAVHFLTAFESEPPRDIRPSVAAAKELYGKGCTTIVGALEKCIARMSLNVGLKNV